MSNRLNRRQFIHRTSAAAAALAFAKQARLTFAQTDAGDQLIPFLDRQGGAPNAAMVRWEELTQWITPAKDFFDVSHYGKQTIDASTWKLRVSGLVQKPIDLTLDQIKAMTKKDVTATLECSGNGANPGFMGAIGNERWTGTPLAPLLKDCGISPDAIEVAFWGADKGKEKLRGAEYEQNFARCLSIADAMREDLILAYEMDGKPLTFGHGFPLRLVVPGWYGIAWVKWLTNIELRDRRLMNRFMARDYVTIRGVEKGDTTEWKESSVGPMNVKSIVARVVKHPDATYTISGAAWTNGTPIKTVELKIDDGPWQPTQLDTEHHAKYSWTFWSYQWKNPTPGEHTLESCVTDEKGKMQPSAEDPEIKLKRTYWEAYARLPRRVKIS